MDGGLTGVSRRDARIVAPLFIERLDLHPSVEIPVLRKNAVAWSHQLGVRETLYTHSLRPNVEQNSLNRFSFDYSTRFVGPKIEKSYGKWRHTIEPGIEYRYRAGAQRLRETIIVDEVDLLADTNEIEYSITNRFIGSYEFLSWRVAQKVFFDPTFGGVLVPGTRNVFAPLMDLTAFAFADSARRFSPLVSTLRIATTPQTSTDIQVDYDTIRDEFRSAGIIGYLNRGQAFSGIAYFFAKRTLTGSPNHQLSGTIGYGNQTRPGISAAVNFAYNIQQRLFQGTTAQLVYNTDCYGLSFEFMQYDIGARKESRLRFALSLKNLGSFGTIRRQERLF
jgi:LPS-assembly protein